MTSPESESTLDPDEPHTPLWFTLLGIGLFLMGGIFLLVTQEDDDSTAVAAANPMEGSVDEPKDEGGAGAQKEAAKPSPEGAARVPAQKTRRDPDPHAGHNH